VGEPLPEGPLPAHVTDEMLARCAEEPIHIPGSIQPHGCLLVLDAGLCVVQASANSREWLGEAPGRLIGSPLASVLGEEAAQQVEEIVREGAARKPVPFRLRLGPSRELVAQTHAMGRLRILELARSAALSPPPDAFARAVAELDEAADEAELVMRAAQAVRREVQYDRVMLYRFSPDGHGEVVAEERKRSLDPFLGLHYPASDIPAQARELCLRNRTRVIADVHYQPVPMVPAGPPGQGSLDMSHCLLRSVSPVHLEYLRNMGVRATLSASIVVDGALWGLLACHHDEPLSPSRASLAFVELVAGAVAARLRTLREARTAKLVKGVEALAGELEAAAADGQPWPALMLPRAGRLRELFACDGVAVLGPDGPACQGAFPGTEALQTLRSWLEARVRRSALALEAAGREVPDLEGDACAGLLAVPLPGQHAGHLVLLRREWRRDVPWAGRAEKGIALDATGQPRLTPRGSFEVWHEEVRGRCRPWSASELEATEALRGRLASIALRSRELASLRLEQDVARVVGALRHGSEPLAIADARGRVLLASRALRERLELGDFAEGGELRALGAALLQPPPELLHALQGLGDWHGDCLVRAASGEPAWMEVVVAPACAEDGSRLGVTVQLRDVSARRLSQAEELRAREDAESASRAKGDFVANVSHEIRTPLHGILGTADLLEKTALQPEQRDLLAVLRSSGEGLLLLLNDLLDVARLESGELAFARGPFAVGDLVSEVAERFRHQARESGLAYHVELGAIAHPVLRGDAERLRQVLANLLSNAVQFTKEGAIRIHVATERTAGHEIELRIAVSDTGVGIAPERLERIFDRFSQLDASSTRRAGGTGLGLYLCRALVERMGGQIMVESEEERGSTFRVRLHLEGHEGEAPAAAVPTADGPLQARILLAEDNPVNQQVARRMLERCGFSVEVVEDGEAALRRVAEGGFDLVLMDCQMPGTDGLEATRRIRGLGGPESRVPIIALTANAHASNRDACLQAGMDDYLTKPVRSADLERAVRQALSR